MEKPWEVDLTIYDNEQQLLAGLRRRDQMACTCLLKDFAPRLLRVSRQLIGDPDEAEDVLQEAFIRACDRIDTFRGESGLGTWLHRIVINTALMRLRKRQLANLPDTDAISDDSQRWQSIASGPIEPSREVLDAELVDQLSESITRLPETVRTAFVLREVEGFSTREAAEILDISESALKVRLHRARLALRQELQQYLIDKPYDQTNEDRGTE
jgi:RNA polymerase sigma-70 factor, ECF subfamily